MRELLRRGGRMVWGTEQHDWNRPKWWLSNTIKHFYFPTRHRIGMLPHTTFTLYLEQYLHITKRSEYFKKSIVTRPQFTLGTIYKSTDMPWIAFTDKVSLRQDYIVPFRVLFPAHMFTGCICAWNGPHAVPFSFLFYLPFGVENPLVSWSWNFAMNKIISVSLLYIVCIPNWSIK